MAKHGRITWRENELRLQVQDLAIEQIDKLALEVIAVAKEPIDTGFLAASAYVNSSSGLNTFDETWEPGQYESRRTNRLQPRDKVAAPEPPPRNGAIAGWAASYALWVEERESFIYRALTTVAGRQ